MRRSRPSDLALAALSLGAVLVACAGRSPAPATPTVAPAAGERHLRNIRQLTDGGNNAEAYFSADGKRIIFQRQPDITKGCDQEYIMNADGSQMHRVANGLGKNTCGYFYAGDSRIIYASWCQPEVGKLSEDARQRHLGV